MKRQTALSLFLCSALAVCAVAPMHPGDLIVDTASASELVKASDASTDLELPITQYHSCKTITVAAVYVSQDGDDSNLGTYNSPVCTIQKGIEIALAHTSGPTAVGHVLLEAGSTFTGVGNKNIIIANNLAFDSYNDGSNPVIDLQHGANLFYINPGCTVSLCNMVIKNGYNDFGGAIENYGTLHATGCSFSANQATDEGGAIYNDGIADITNSRFVDNNAMVSGNAIYNANGVVTALNNWWNTNLPCESSLFGGEKVDYKPYLVFRFWPISTVSTVLGPTSITLDFTRNSFGQAHNSSTFDGLPIFFDITEGTVSPSATTVQGGYAYTTVSDVLLSGTFSVATYIDTDLTNNPYALRATGTSAQTVVVYVSLQGTDTNPGTIGSPVRTIQKGLEIVQTTSYGSMYLEAGNTFTGTNNTNLTIGVYSLIIDRYGTGADPIIDMQGSGQFCTINSTVTMNNLVIQGGAGDSQGDGGAITNNGTLYANSCTFNQNFAYDGGAIENDGGILSATDCIFNSNNVSGAGGAIENGGTLHIAGCTFSNNSAGNEGGAIDNNGLLSGSSCIFNNNSAHPSEDGFGGGAIENYGASTLACCRFVGNSAPSGSAIRIIGGGGVTATNCWWGTNTPDAGSLFFGPVTYKPYIVLNLFPDPLWPRQQCASPVTADFTLNSSGQPNGCTIMEGTPVIFSANNVDVNVSPTLSYVVDGQAQTTLYDIPNTNTFSVCAQTDTDLSVAGYTYCETATPYNFTAIWVSALDGDDANLGNSPSNPVKTIARGLERLSCVTTNVVYLYLETGNTFTGTGNQDLTITLSTLYISTYTSSHGSADPIIDMQGLGQFCTINSTCTVTINNLVMQNGAGDIYGHGGAITNNGILYAGSCTFSDNEAHFGGALYTMGVLNATGCTFDSNSTDYNGGAIENNHGTANIVNSIFTNNSADLQGGAIDSNSSLYAATCVFSNNNASDGSAICNSTQTATVTCSRFVNNGSGTVIYNYPSGIVNAQNNWWGSNNNPAALFGGVVTYTPWIVMNLLPDPLWLRLGCQLPITADFTHNSDSTTNGCAVMDGMPVIFSATAPDVVISPTLSYVVDGQATATLYDSRDTSAFSVCAETDTDLSTIGYMLCETATPFQATAVYVSAMDGNDIYPGTRAYPVKTIAQALVLAECPTTTTIYLEAGNTFTGTGNKDLTITLSSVYIGTYIGSHGTANPTIDMQGSKRFCTIAATATVSMNNLVIQNGAGDPGGAVYNSGTLNATGCTFSNNTSDDNGGAIYNFGSTTTITCSRFIGNTAGIAANAIYNEGGDVYAQNCWWATNYPDEIALFGSVGVVTYKPYIVLNLFPNPLWPRVQCASPVTADFTQNSLGQPNGCTIMEGTPVIFSVAAADVTISPTLSYVVDGQAQATLYDIPDTNTFSVCAETDTDLTTIGYTYCQTATPLATSAAYVSAIDGSDDYPGTEDYPVRTIAHGLELLNCVSTGTAYLYLEAGNTFTGTGNTNLTITGTNLFISTYTGAHGIADPIIDMQNIADTRFAIINAVSNVTLNNLVIQNGYATGNGGAILNNGVLYAIACTFSGNSSVADYGGAIYNNGTILNVAGCTFSHNSSAAGGGALYNNGNTLNVAGCIFSHNTVSAEGGAIRNSSGALYATGCIFSNNYSGGGGGAIESDFGTLDIIGCTLFSNSTPSIGGALFNFSGTATVTCCRFIGNTASLFGNAIYNNGGAVQAPDNWWGTNSPAGLFGGTYITYKPYIILNLFPNPLWPRLGCQVPVLADFTQNSSGQTHGCTIMNGTPVIFSVTAPDVVISPTLSYVVDGQAPATLYDSRDTNTFSICAETDTDLSVVGYTYCQTATPLATSTVYVSAIDGNDDYPGTQGYPVRTIARGLAELNGVTTGTAYLYLETGNTFTGTGNQDLTITLSNLYISTYTGSHGTANPTIDMAGSAQFCTINSTSTVTMNNLLIQNSTGTYGGAITNRGFLYANSCTFSGNNASGYGGAIYNNSGMLSTTGCIFNNNYASEGGAIKSETYLNTTNCTFSGNHASVYGGAISSVAKIFNATNCTFSNNRANDGGALYSTEDSILHAAGCTFDQNSANNAGGAIQTYQATITVICSRFVGNSAPSGSAIYDYESTVNAQNNWWGTNTPDPSSLFANTVPLGSYSPWIVMNLLPNPLWLQLGRQLLAVADFTHNSDGTTNGCTVMDGSPVIFGADNIDVIISPTLGYVVAGQAQTTLYDSLDTNTFLFCAQADTDLSSTGYTYCVTATPLVLTAIWVSAIDGDDANMGNSPSNPVRTIAHGLELLNSGTTGTVYLYLETGNTFTGASNKDLTITLSDLYIGTYTGSHGITDPVIDMQGSKRFCTINPGISVTMNSLIIQNGNVNSDCGAAIYNSGNLDATGCTFSSNSAANGAAIFNINGTLNTTGCIFSNNNALYGGAIENDGNLIATGCTFGNNSAGKSGGAIYNSLSTATVTCSRFVGNTATAGNAIYNQAGTVIAINNWWGTNVPNVSALFGASTVDYVPYLVVNFIPSPMSPRLQCPYSIAADFTQNSSGNPSGCTIFEGVPVRFSSTESIEPTLSYVLNGYADTTLYDIPNTNTFTVCLYTDSDLTTSWYQFCTTATPRNLLAVYVSPNGNDSNLGDTPSNPVQTISVALQHISCITTGTIYLETGATFTGQGNTNITISFSVNFSTYGTDADPIIDMQGLGQFCTINSTCTVTINNLIMQNGTGDIHGYGGALTNNGILYANSCTFSGNSSAAGGGALYNNGNTLNAIGCIFSYNTVSGEGGAINNVAGTLTVANCTFNNNYSSSGGGAIQNDSGTLDIVGCTLFSNSTPSAGGALFNYVGTATVTCSRFVGNAAGFGSAIFNGGGTVNAQNCWWGTNTPDAGSLFSGPVTYKPYIVLNLFPNLLWPRLGCQVPVLADFTQNSSGQPNGCTIMEGTPVIFSVTATDVVISPTLSYVVNGQAETTLYDIPDTNTFSVCAETDTDLSTTGYTYCQTATPLAIPAAYVSAIDGNDDYPGTQDYPVRTIAHGLELLNCVSTGTAYLYLEAGNTFTGTGNTNLTITLSNLYISTYTGSHGTANPIIDMQNSGRFCIIDADITVTMYNLVMQHGTVIDVQGGAVYNSGTLNIINCIFANNMSTLYGVGGAIENFGTLNATSCVFNNNNAVIEGGAIDNHYILNAAGCTFSNNSASTGGAIFNGSTGAITVICSRFIGNIASPGSAIYNSFGTVNAQNNWWGTNTPNPTSLFYGQVTYKPYIVMNLFPNPLWPRVQCASPVTADFTQNSSGQPNGCTIMEGMPVIFSVTAADVIISPTLSYVVAGLAQATLYDIPGTSTFSVCAETDTDLSTIGYTYCETATPLASMAVYVSATSGNDEYPGTQAYPVQTIARGLVLVQCATTATIYLEAGNTFTGNNNINLTLNINNLTIDRYGAGADPILDMSGMPAPAQFCTIVSTVTVTMNNLVLQNGYADDVYGGAIYNYGTLLATGCTFSGNSSARFGGAIENAGTLNATGCTFSNNSAGSEAGGAISNDGTLNVAGCTFSNNSAGGGAAIYNLGNLNATGCTFINNSAGGGAGGAIYNSLSTATVTCSRFVGNTATSGHAIYNQGGIVTAQNNWWGTNDPDAHVLFGVSTVDYIPYLVVNFAPSPMSPRLQCPYPIAADFTQNSSGQVSGCTIFEGVPVHFSSTESIEPTLSYVLNGYADTTLYDILSTNTFTVCLYADSDLTTTWYQFCTTATPRDLLAVYVSPSGNDNNLGDTPFNPVRTIARALQHVSCVSVGTIYLEAGATFTGAGNNDLVLTSSVNFDRYGLGVDPIIDMQGVENFCTVGPEVAVSMSNLVLANGHANDGGAIACFNDTSVLTLSLCTFNSNAALNGGAILTLGDLMASNCVFNDNAATSGGALYADTLTLSDCTFNSNAATNGPGGALLLYGTLTASGCTFNGNSATGATGWGGAIFNTVSSAVSGCTFDGNVAVCGGALYNYSNGQATVSCCRLVDNSATSSGNAIYNASATTAVQAQNNWWGFNSDPSALLYGDVSYAPWIELSVSINPLLVYPGQTTVFAATFSSSCIPDGTPIAFSTTDGAITPTFATTVDGQATAIVTLSYDGLPFVVTAIVAPEAEAFELSLTITPITITLAKSASYTTLLPGDTIDYRYVMRNIGSTDLFNILLTDNRFSSTICSNPLLEQAETMTCTASYIITQADVDSGVITNTATAYATDVGGDQFVVTSSLTIPIAQLPSIQLVKTATYSLLLPSYPIEYLYAVQNTGNVTLQNIVLTDNRFTDTICTQATLAPAETMNCSATYIITQTDRTNESVTNIATAAGYPPSGIPVTYSDSLTITIPQPSMTLLKLINSNDASATWPGLIVPLGSTMALNYQVKNTGNVALYAVQVTDDQGYHIIQPKTTLAPDESMTCTATAVAPALNALHVNNATVTATSVDILPITSTASAYATSVAIGLYRINWGCTCTDMNTRHLLVGSHNSGDLNNNILDGWIFDPTITPSCQELTPLALGSQVIVCSAVYTSTEETVIAVLIQDQGGSSYVIVATVEGTNIVLQSMTQLPSVAFKLQWYGENSGEAYLVTDEYENISLYSVDLSSYTLTRIATTPNLAAGVPSTFLCWFPQSSDIYIVQGYNATNIVTYKVNLGASTIDNGVVTNVASVYSHVNACSTCYNYLVLGGIRGTESLLGYHWINGSGHIGGPLPYTSFAGATTVNYCERCCCNNDHLLVGTDSGLYSVDAQTFAIVATNTTMSVNNWVNVCWCCASNKTYCAASDGASNGFIFKEQSGALEPVYNL